jgi:hypothetical protein
MPTYGSTLAVGVKLKPFDDQKRRLTARAIIFTGVLCWRVMTFDGVALVSQFSWPPHEIAKNLCGVSDIGDHGS